MSSKTENKNLNNLNINDLNNIEEEEEKEKSEKSENTELLTLNNISICQLCKNIFDNKEHIPYLFKCEHFFCKKCISNELINSEKKIFCPIHGIVANSLKELKILSNFIYKKDEIKEKLNNDNNYCQIHKGIKMTHVIEGTKKIFCIYCAIDLYKKDQNLKIKEINEIIDIYKKEIIKIKNYSINNAQKIKSIIDINNKEKNDEIGKIKVYFEKIFEIINLIKNKILKNIESIDKKNNNLINYKIQILLNLNDQCEDCLKIIESNKNDNYKYIEIFDNYFNIKKLNDENKNIISDINKKLFKFNNIYDKKDINDIILKLKNIKINISNNNIKTENKIIEKKNYEKLKLKEYLDNYKNKEINNNYYYSYNISNINNNSFISNNKEKKINQNKKNTIKNNSNFNKLNYYIKNKKALINNHNYEYKGNKTYNNINENNLGLYKLDNDNINDNNILSKTNDILYNKTHDISFNFK